MKNTMNPLPLACVFVLSSSFSVYSGELDRYMEWQNRRDYEQNQKQRDERMQAIVDQHMDSVMQMRQSQTEYLMRVAAEHPSFETEMAALNSARPPMSFPGLVKNWFVMKRALHEKWGVEYDDTEEREVLGNLKGGNPQNPKLAHGDKKKVSIKSSDTREVMTAAEYGRRYAENIAELFRSDSDSDQPSSEITHESNVPFQQIWPAAPLIRPGQRHPTVAHVVLSENLEWIPDAGYSWNVKPEERVGDDSWMNKGVKWSPGIEHFQHKHVIAAEKEGTWEPESGWKFVSHKSDDWAVARE